MKKINRRTLGMAIALSLFCGIPLASSAAFTPISNQTETDTQINTPLQSGDFTYTTATSDSYAGNFSQINAGSPIHIHGEANTPGSLTMEHAPAVTTVWRSIYSNINSDNAAHNISFSDLNSLTLKLSGTAATSSYRPSNILLTNSGELTIQDTVKEFTVENSLQRAGGSDNIYVINNSTARIYSPNVTLSREINGNNVFVFAGSNEAAHAAIYFGREDHPLDTVSIKSTNPNFIADEAFQVTSGDQADSSARAYVFTKSLLTSNVYWGYRAEGSRVTDNSPNQGALIQMGSANTPIDQINFDNVDYNVCADYGGKINIFAHTITTDHALEVLMADNKGTVNVTADNFIVGSDVRHSIDAQSGTNISLHTKGKAILRGTSGTAINNRGDTVSVNTNENEDGTTIVEGTIDNGFGATTHISFHTPDSRFYGNAFTSETGSDVFINVSHGAVWTLNPTVTVAYSPYYNSRINTLHLSDGGTVDLGGLGTEPGASNTHANMEVMNLTGGGGTFVFRTNLQDSAETRTVTNHSDVLEIAPLARYSSSSSGTYNILINDHSRSLGHEIDNAYVLLVRDRSSNHNALFKGSARLQNGGLLARKVEITNEEPDSSLGYSDIPSFPSRPDDATFWYARVMNESGGLTENAENNMTFSRSRYGALWIEQETLRQRLGELRDHKQDDGIWARITRGEYTMNGVSGNADYTMYHIGYDKKIGNQKGHKQYVGMAYHHTDTDLNYRHFTDDSDMDADIGTIYYTNLGDKGHYLDIVGKFGRMKGKMKTFGEFPESAKWDSPFYSLSAEYGRKILYNNGWYWEPQAQLTYSHLGSDNYLTSQGTHAHVDNINSLIFRTGFTVGKKNGRNEYYGKVFWHHEFEGAEDAYFHDKNDFRLHDSYDFGSSWVTVGLGGQVGLSKDAYLYGDVEKSFGGDVKKKWAWNIGVRFGF